MKKLLGIVFLSLLLTITIAQSKTRQELHNDGVIALKEGGKIIYLRHAYAPRTVENGNYDKNYKEKKCSTQRDILSEGIKQSEYIGKFILENGINIEKVISSSAKRTTQTSIALVKAINYPISDIQFEDTIYHSSVTIMMQFINDVDNSIDTMMLVAHNPGISMLCDYLCGDFFEFPTLGMVKITFDTQDWQEIFRDTGSLEWVDYPKMSIKIQTNI